MIVKGFDLVGRQFGNYKILSELGRGGMAIVYKADELSLNRVVALKVLSPKISQDETMIKRFQREAQAAAQLNHPNIVHVYAIGQEDGIDYFTMEYIKGQTLRQLRKAKGKVSVRETIPMILAVADALGDAHKAGLVHRDVKPSNIMLDPAGRVKVTDFGLARVSQATTKLTVDGSFLGTPEYMSPEQCEAKAVDARSDIYSLGVSFYELLTGKAPFQADTPASMLVKIMKGDVRPIRELDPSIPVSVEKVIMKMLNTDAGKRFKSTDELIKTLKRVEEELASGQQDASEDATAFSVAVDKSRVPSWVGPLLGVGMLLLIVGLCATAWKLLSPKEVSDESATPPSSRPEAGMPVASPESGQELGTTELKPATLDHGGPPGPDADIKAVEGTETGSHSRGGEAVDVGRGLVRSEVAPPVMTTAGLNADGVDPAVEETSPDVPKIVAPTNSVVVALSGNADTRDVVGTYAEGALSSHGFQVVDASSLPGKPAASLARHRLSLKANKVGTRTLRFHGTRSELTTILVTLKVTETDTGKVVGTPAMKRVEYTSLNLEENVKEGVVDLIDKVAGSMKVKP